MPAFVAAAAEAIQKIAADKPRSIIFVCGRGGTGKTTFCQQLAEVLTPSPRHFERRAVRPEVEKSGSLRGRRNPDPSTSPMASLGMTGLPAVIFKTDLYAKYATEERKRRIAEALASSDPARIEAEENPRNWYDWETLKKDLAQLRDTSALEIRDGWNQATGLKDANESLRLAPDAPGVILVDGIYLLDPDIRPLADLVILLEASLEALEQRRLQRDGHRSSPEYLRYKASLGEKYDTPYFVQYASHAHLVCQTG